VKRRTLSVLLIGQNMAEGRRRYRTLITSWPTSELADRESVYSGIVARGQTDTRVFYLTRLRAIRHELAQRAEVVK
jgi:hypothetical protein